ncbi:hypothetical protein GCM10011361_18910 [Muriicola marianensis]|uniref:TonB family protein n=2 Tax=Muriicola marianensis TaxID=1324801 RepID=A0ABQ1QZ79_9FLAO|nr:hypothetical protein GCM10011361_18910 [Muriicola marianensis]
MVMAKFLKYFDWIKDLSRNQLSFIITFFSLSIMVLLLFNLHLGAEEQDEYVIELSLADEELVELLEQEEKKAEELDNQDLEKTNRAMNETAKPSIGAPEPLKTLEELLEEQQMNADDSPDDLLQDDEAYRASLKELAKIREERKQQLGEKEADKKEYTDNLINKRTRISYSLVDRTSYDLPPPIYTCLEGGKVVINIKVDRLGYVTEVDFNATSSSTDNGCLVENALKYAAQARFSPGSKQIQLGTITYLFQSK